MTVEDRLRATTAAVAETMRPVRPLNLRPTQADAQASTKRRLPRHPRRWPGWLIPLAAAMAVIAVAATLVAVKSLSADGPGLRPAPTSPPPATSSASVPRYYVDLGPMGRDGRPTQAAVLADTRTGKQLATFSPPPGHVFTYTAGSADDKTFVLLAAPSFALKTSKTEEPSSVWYVLRLPSGAPQQARLTWLPAVTLSADTAALGFAVSPDGRTLALLLQVISHVGSKKTLAYGLAVRTYSLATGQALRTWSDPAGPLSPTGPGTFNVSWLNDGRTIAFAASSRAVPEGIRFLDTAKPGTSLTSSSRPVFSAAANRNCGTMLLTPDGKAVICGTYAPNNSACTAGQLEVTAYSVATGKLERVLYRYRGSCQPGGTAQVIWAPSGTLAVGAIFVGSPKHNVVGLMTPGKFTALPFLSNGGDYQTGTIAF